MWFWWKSHFFVSCGFGGRATCSHQYFRFRWRRFESGCHHFIFFLTFSLFYSFSGFLGPFQSNAKGKKRGLFAKMILNFPSQRVELGPRDLKAKLLTTLPWRLVQKSSFKLRIYTTYIIKLVTMKLSNCSALTSSHCHMPHTTWVK
jgi:hypothetical protein